MYWSENGDLVAIVTEDSYYILRYNAAEAAQSFATNQGIDEDGVESALDVRWRGGGHLMRGGGAGQWLFDERWRGGAVAV